MDLLPDLAINIDSIKTEDDANKLVNVLESFSHKHNWVSVIATIYFIKNDQFNEVKDYFKKM